MSLLSGLLFPFCLVAAASLFVIIWRIWQEMREGWDLFPCPECESSKVEHPEGVDGAFNRCLNCGKEWRDDEPI